MNFNEIEVFREYFESFIKLETNDIVEIRIPFECFEILYWLDLADIQGSAVLVHQTHVPILVNDYQKAERILLPKKMKSWSWSFIYILPRDYPRFSEHLAYHARQDLQRWEGLLFALRIVLNYLYPVMLLFASLMSNEIWVNHYIMGEKIWENIWK